MKSSSILALAVVTIASAQNIDLFKPLRVGFEFVLLLELFFGPFFVVVEIMPAFVGWMVGVGGKDVEGEPRPAAVGGRAHPETVEPVARALDPLEPHLIAHERPPAVQAEAFARHLRGRHRVALALCLVGAAGTVTPAVAGAAVTRVRAAHGVTTASYTWRAAVKERVESPHSPSSNEVMPRAAMMSQCQCVHGSRLCAVCHQARLLQQNCHVSPLSLSSTARDHPVE